MRLPRISLLNYAPSAESREYPDGESLAECICDWGVPCELVRSVLASQVATYHINLFRPTDITKIPRICKGLSAMLHCNVTAGHSKIAHVSIICPVERCTEFLYKLMCEYTIRKEQESKRLFAVLGRDTNGNPVGVDIEKAPHILIAGATGSGKSVLVNSIVTSLLFRVYPSECQLVMIDPKQVEFKNYNGLPHLAVPVVNSCAGAVKTLNGLCRFMDVRYKLMQKMNAKDAESAGLPSLIVVIDELADLMLTSRFEAETPIIRLAQLGRAAGIHLIIATQRPTANVITGLIKSNIPCKIALQTSSIRDSMNILDHKGAESLTGKGDALLKLPDRVEEIRFQSAYISSDDTERVVAHWAREAAISF